MKANLDQLIRECNKQITEINEIPDSTWLDIWVNNTPEYERLFDRKAQLAKIYNELVTANERFNNIGQILAAK